MTTKNETTKTETAAELEASALNDLLYGKNFAVFGFTRNSCDGDIEQLTHWNTLTDTKTSKSNWFEKDRHTFVMARIAV